MITYAYLKDSLNKIDKLYDESKNQKETIFYSKLALIELCGWIEESMDDIVNVYAKRKLKTVAFKRTHSRIVKRNHGFLYSDHFKPMLIQSVGIIQVEKLETKLNRSGKIDILESECISLNLLRNKAAHTFTKGITATFSAPSSILGIFEIIYPILIKIEKEIRAL